MQGESMSITTHPPTAPPPAAPASGDTWSPRARLAGWLLTLAWLVLLATVAVTGEREASLPALERAVASKQVDRVEVAGEVLPPGARGRWAVRVRWREGLTTRSVPVVQASSPRQARRIGSHGGAVVIGSIEDHLKMFDPRLEVAHDGEWGPSGPYVEWRSWRADGWAAVTYLVLLLATIAMANLRSRPWRATPWAWTWLMLLAPPFGITGFLLLGGPTGLFRPADPSRVRLTGGWAFLLAAVLGGSAAS